MAKYIIAFTILLLLVLENNCIFKRLYVESLPNVRTDATINMQRQQVHQESINFPHSSRPHRHKRMQSTTYRQHKHIASNSHRQSRRDTSIKTDLLQHRLYKRYTRSNTDNSNHADVRTMPRPWTQLLMEDEYMYADGPMPSNEENSNVSVLGNEDFNDVSYSQSSADQHSDEPGGESNIDYSASVEVPIEVEKNHDSNSHRQSSGYRCPKCDVARKVEHITEEELTRLRIEFVKTQILEKLRLKERPNVSAVALPKPIQEGVTIDQGDENSKNKELDDYYARTSKKFIFLEREIRECERTGIQPSICFSFKIDDADADGFDVSTAVLWIYKNKMKTKEKKARTKDATHNRTIRNQETIVVSEVQQPLDLKFQPIVKTIAIQTVVDQDKWLEIDIEWPIKRWFGNHDLSHLIQISCESCDITAIDRFDKDYRPFIMIDTQNRRRSSRQKRGINCTDGVTECCREKLYISFEDIGWGDWIIQPRGYDAYFCRGSCGSVASIAQSSSHHSTFLQKVVAMNRGKGREPLELIPCCTAKQYSSLQLVFMDSNNTATQKTFPNMVIESCGCR